jgi:predicted DNA-binding transcriptional regulator AlpA
MEIEQLLDINDVAKITKLKVATLRRHVLLKQIPYHKVIKAIRFRGSEIQQWIDDDGSCEGIASKPVLGEGLFSNDEPEAVKCNSAGYVDVTVL